MSDLRYRKYEGLGNDFLIVESDALSAPPTAEQAQAWCDRETGVGADGVIIHSEEGGRHRMRVLNADGSEPQICGNGLRCLARYLVEHRGHPADTPLDFDTLAGPCSATVLLAASGEVSAVRVDMGAPSFERAALPMRGEEGGEEAVIQLEIAGRPMPMAGTPVSMGNPHFVIFGGEGHASEHFAGRLGPRIAGHEDFPEGVNVGFVETAGAKALKAVIWERGSGLTQACGTGACAAAVAAAQKGWLPYGEEVRVELPGGALEIVVEEGNARVWMTGPCTEVGTGVLP